MMHWWRKCRLWAHISQISSRKIKVYLYGCSVWTNTVIIPNMVQKRTSAKVITLIFHVVVVFDWNATISRDEELSKLNYQQQSVSQLQIYQTSGEKIVSAVWRKFCLDICQFTLGCFRSYDLCLFVISKPAKSFFAHYIFLRKVIFFCGNIFVSGYLWDSTEQKKKGGGEGNNERTCTVIYLCWYDIIVVNISLATLKRLSFKILARCPDKEIWMASGQTVEVRVLVDRSICAEISFIELKLFLWQVEGHYTWTLVAFCIILW